MTPITLTLALVVVAAAVLLPAYRALRGRSDAFWPIISVVVGGTLLLTAVMVPTIVYGSRHFDRITCRTFARQTGRATKFVLYNSFSTGDCLTPTGDGRWIPTSNLREFGGKS